MDKITCNIILDLIPLYVDELCSEDTRKCVEEHTAQCENCRRALELCKNREFSERSFETRQLNAMKKVNRKLKVQKILLYIFLLLIVLLGFGMFTGNEFALHLTDYYFITMLLMLGYVFLLWNRKNLNPPEKKDVLLAILSACGSLLYLICYCVILFTVTARMEFMGLPAASTGPRLNLIFLFCFFFQFALFVHGLFRLLGRNADTSVRGIIHLTGLCLLLRNNNFLYHMEEINSLNNAVLSSSVFCIVMGGIFCAISLLIRKQKYKTALKSNKASDLYE